MDQKIRYWTEYYLRNNGNTIPAVALGTWQSGEEGDVVYKAVKAAIAAGYRHIDTAMMVR